MKVTFFVFAFIDICHRISLICRKMQHTLTIVRPRTNKKKMKEKCFNWSHKYSSSIRQYILWRFAQASNRCRCRFFVCLLILSLSRRISARRRRRRGCAEQWYLVELWAVFHSVPFLQNIFVSDVKCGDFKLANVKYNVHRMERWTFRLHCPARLFPAESYSFAVLSWNRSQTKREIHITSY